MHGGAFEEAFAAYQGAAHGVLMMNGTVTMEVACKALGIGWGDEVIVPALTFAATAYAPMAAGALPGLRRRHARHLDDRPRPGRGRDHRPHAGDHARPPRAPDGGHGPDHGDRAAPRPGGDRGLRARATASAGATSGAGCIGDFGSFSHQSSKILTSGEGGTLLTSDDALARRAHSIIDCGRAKDPDEKEYTFGANYRLSELNAALLVVAMRRFPAQQDAARDRRARRSRRWPPRSPACASCRTTRASRGGASTTTSSRSTRTRSRARTNEVVCAAMEAEGIPAEVQYPSMNRYELFQPSLSRLPVAVEHADRLDPATMSFPVAEAAGQRESVYFMENVFRDGERGIRDAAEALAKIQANAAELPRGLALSRRGRTAAGSGG